MQSDGWIDMRERRPTEQDALMDASGELAVEVLCRHEHGYYPMIVALQWIAEAGERAGKYYPFWRAIPPMPGSLVPWHVYYRWGGRSAGLTDNSHNKKSPCDGGFFDWGCINTGL